MTVAELKAAIASLPDDTEVFMLASGASRNQRSTVKTISVVGEGISRAVYIRDFYVNTSPAREIQAHDGNVYVMDWGATKKL